MVYAQIISQTIVQSEFFTGGLIMQEKLILIGNGMGPYAYARKVPQMESGIYEITAMLLSA